MSEKSSAITNGVDLDRFKPDGNEVDKSRGEGDAILAVGSVHAGKNFKGLVEGMHEYKLIYDDPPTVRWAGREPDTDRDKAVLKEANDALLHYGLEDRWEWLGVRADVPDLLARHDAFIHPSLFEGLPNAVCEALAAGRPVLASNVCDHPWLVADGQRGFLFDPLDPKGIAHAIRRFVLLTSDQRREMGKRARSFAEQALAVEVFVDNYEQLFVSII
jgi:glycosyltransferase involved in cell wall biosynthesis